MSSPKPLSTRLGERTGPDGNPVRNKILLSLPDDEYARVRPHLEFLEMPDHLTLQEPHRLVKYAHLPNEGLISLVVELKNGRSVEAGVVGTEGITGIASILGLNRSMLREIVQIRGSGFRIKISELKPILAMAPQFSLTLHRYSAGLSMQMAQTAACNRAHKVEERLARWLLLAQDRVGSNIICITHDFLSTMLGTDRPSVSLAAGVLQKHKLTEYARGVIKIVNRKKLESFACECYGMVRDYTGHRG